jgi:MarR family transcriptional regulator, lower aerobic nicotinate degradation pathway regulator
VYTYCMGTHVSRGADVQAVLDGVRRIVQALRASSRWAERHVGLSGAQLFVLQKLAESPGISVNELAERTHTHQSSVSVVVSRLAALGLVTRTRSTADGRRVELSLAARARRVVGRAPDVAQERLIRGIERLPPARRHDLALVLGHLATAMQADTSPPRMFFEERTATRPVRRKARRG